MALTQRKKPQFKNLKIILCYIVFGILYLVKMGFPSGARSKETSCQCKRLEKWVRSIPGSGRSPAGGTATHSSILAMDRGAWRATVHGVAKSQTQLR